MEIKGARSVYSITVHVMSVNYGGLRIYIFFLSKKQVGFIPITQIFLRH